MSTKTEEDRKREFRRQQDRLKMMAAPTERNVVTADAMIDNLLQKSDTFRRVTNNLPLWLQADSTSSCQYYNKIWEAVKLSDKMVDTQRISQILLTSGLHPDILGYIWNLANKETPGLLTKQELFVVLALVALAQSGHSFNDLSVLNSVQAPPFPRLLLPFQPVLTAQPNSNASLPNSMGSIISSDLRASSNVLSPTPSYQRHTDVPMANTAMHHNNIVESNFNSPSSALAGPTIRSESSNNLETISKNHLSTISSLPADDDFDDFQCVTINKLQSPVPVPNNIADKLPQDLFDVTSLPNKGILEDSSNKPALDKSIAFKADGEGLDDFSDFQSATNTIDPTPPGGITKISSFIKVSPESERKLRYLAKPASLTALPESKISSNNHVSAMPSIAVVGASRSIGSRLANHSIPATKSEKNRHQIKLKEPGDEMFPKCIKPPSFLLKETKIPSTEKDPEPDMKDLEVTRHIEIPRVGTFRETTLPVAKKIDANAPETPANDEPELFSMTEDKYGALREIDNIMQMTGDTEAKGVEEDFGDFLSADLPTDKAIEAWTAWNSSVVEVDPLHNINHKEAQLPQDTPILSSFPNLELTTTVISLPEVKMPVEVNEGIDEFCDFKSANDSESAQPKIESNLKLEHKIKPIQSNYDIREFIDDFGDFIVSTEDQIAPTVDDGASLHSSTPSCDFSTTQNGSWNSLDLQSGSPSRKGSVPSLNLKSDGENLVGKRCLKCCFQLLKEAANIFRGVSDKLALHEVFQTVQARNYLKYLGVVYSISNRVSLNGEGSFAILNDITSLWEEIKDTAGQFSVMIEEPAELEVTSGSLPCGVCRGPTSLNDVSHNGSKFHASCANLWVNCIDVELPC